MRWRGILRDRRRRAEENGDSDERMKEMAGVPASAHEDHWCAVVSADGMRSHSLMKFNPLNSMEHQARSAMVMLLIVPRADELAGVIEDDLPAAL
jgi:hypothetical protein